MVREAFATVDSPVLCAGVLDVCQALSARHSTHTCVAMWIKLRYEHINGLSPIERAVDGPMRRSSCRARSVHG